MKRYISILTAIAIVVILPIAFKRTNVSLSDKADDTLVIITPHNEAIRLEMDLGFREWYLKETGRTVAIDWRVPGSTGDIIRYIHSIYNNAFRVYWENSLKKNWTPEIQEGFVAKHPETILEAEARECFLHSDVSCGVDLFFGGGVVEHKKEAELGDTVPSGVIELHPDWFCDDCIPARKDGDYLWDPRGVWLGTSLSGFGIMYNMDRIQDLQLPSAPTTWADLTKPEFFRQIAMVDPVQSSVVIKSLEMIFQQQMQQARKEILAKTHQEELNEQQLHEALNEGWLRGLKLVQKIMANSRYFTDNSVTTVWDVSLGNCAVGVVVDFYGRHQKSSTISRGGKDRIRFVFPKGGSCLSPDPISMFRGAPHKEVAKAFIEYVVSEAGQDRAGFKTGVPGGPKYYALHRTPLRRDFYQEKKVPWMSSPEMNPFKSVNEFEYQSQWTAPAFGAIRFLAKVLFMDPFTELASAWHAIIKAQKEGRKEQAASALALLENFEGITYDWTMDTLSKVLKSKNALLRIKLETELTQRYCNQYKEAYKAASKK